jgi:hypothetical protein
MGLVHFLRKVAACKEPCHDVFSFQGFLGEDIKNYAEFAR